MPSPVQAPIAWRVVALLFLVNLLNFFDRAVPAIVIEPIRQEWGLNDTELGLAAAAFTIGLVFAGIPLGRLADRAARKFVLGWGVLAWSAATALGGAAGSFGAFLMTRALVGVGEASCLPSATSMIGDLFPPSRRARATGIFMLGLPVGLMLAYVVVPSLVDLFGSWRAPFIFALIPGVLVALLLFAIREPIRGASEAASSGDMQVPRPIRAVLAIPSMRWIIVAAVVYSCAIYATNTFTVPVMQRYFGQSLSDAALSTGVIVGVTGLIGLVLGGFVADWAHRRRDGGRLLLAGFSLTGAAIATGLALLLPADAPGAFVIVFGFGWLLQYIFYVGLYPAIHDVVEPRLRGTAMAVMLVVTALLGGALGPVALGYLSDGLANAAMERAGASGMTDGFRAIGLHGAMVLVPVCLLLAAAAIFVAARSFPQDRRAMRARIGAPDIEVDPA